MSVHRSEIKKITTHQLQAMKNRGEKIAMLTAYDYSMARIVDQAGIDIILVGDSASNVMAGNETTLPITLDHMIYHATSVVRAVDRALVVVDIPFGSYQGNSSEALRSTVRIMKESGAHAIKMEGGAEIKESITRILSAGVPVMGHLGLTPQSIFKFEQARPHLEDVCPPDRHRSQPPVVGVTLFPRLLTKTADKGSILKDLFKSHQFEHHVRLWRRRQWRREVRLDCAVQGPALGSHRGRDRKLLRGGPAQGR